MKRVTTILGDGQDAAALGLKKILNKPNNPWLILDYSGRLSLILSNNTQTKIQPDSVFWYDLANRLAPHGVLKLHPSPYLPPILLSLLQALRSISQIMISDASLQQLVDVTMELGKHGNITLEALLRCIVNNKLRNAFIGTCSDRCPSGGCPLTSACKYLPDSP